MKRPVIHYVEVEDSSQTETAAEQLINDGEFPHGVMGAYGFQETQELVVCLI